MTLETSIATGRIHPALTTSASTTREALRARLGILGLALILLVSAGLYVWHWDYFPVGTYLDDAHYIVTARGLATGAGFALVNYPSHMPELKYPPGFSLLLAPIAAVAGTNLEPFKLPNLALAIATLPIWFVLLKRWLPTPAALIVLAAFGTNALIAETSAQVLSEPLFLFLLSLLLLSVDSWVRPGRHLSARHCVGLAALLVALAFVRTTGDVYAAALLGFLLINRRIREAVIVGLLIAPPLAAWAWRNHVAGGGLISAGYEQELMSPAARSVGISDLLASTVERVVSNVTYYATSGMPDAFGMWLHGESVGRLLSSLQVALHAPWILDVVGGLVALIAVAGIALRARRHRFAELSALLYLVVLLLWSGVAGRLVLPILPLLYLGVFESVAISSRFFQRRLSSPRLAVVAPMLALAFVVAWNLDRNAESLLHVKRNPMDFAIGSAWLAEHAPSDAVVMSEWPVLRYLYADRQMIDPPRPGAEETRLKTILGSSANFILITPPHYEFNANLDDQAQAMLTLVTTRPETFRRVFIDERRHVSVYEIER